MNEMDKILLAVVIIVGGGFAASIIYVCKKHVCVKTDTLDIVSEVDVTYNNIYRNFE